MRGILKFHKRFKLNDKKLQKKVLNLNIFSDFYTVTD